MIQNLFIMCFMMFGCAFKFLFLLIVPFWNVGDSLISQSSLPDQTFRNSSPFLFITMPKAMKAMKKAKKAAAPAPAMKAMTAMK